MQAAYMAFLSVQLIAVSRQAGGAFEAFVTGLQSGCFAPKSYLLDELSNLEIGSKTGVEIGFDLGFDHG